MSEDVRRCTAKTTRGTRCKNPAMRGESYCGTHKPAEAVARSGRPTECDARLIQQFANVLNAGNFVETACDYLGVPRSTFYQWLDRASKARERVEAGGYTPTANEALWIELADTIARAQAGAEIASVARIRKAAAAGDIEADKFFLLYGRQQRWGRRKVELEHSGGVKLELNVKPPRVLTAEDEG